MYASNASTFSHSCNNSLTSGCKYTLISLPGPFSPGIIIDTMIDDCFMQSQRGKLKGVNNTSQVLCVLLMTRTGLNPSLASPNLTFCGSHEKTSYRSSKSFHALPSVGCLRIPSLVLSLWCQIISLAILDDLYILSSLGMKGK